MNGISGIQTGRANGGNEEMQNEPLGMLVSTVQMTERPQPVPAPGGRRVFPTVTLIAGRKRGANTDEREWALLVAMNRIGQRGFEVAFFGEDQIVMKRQVK